MVIRTWGKVSECSADLEADLTVEKLRVRGRYEYNNWDWTIADREQRAFFWFSRGFW